jgi:hypothetical protein
LLIGSIALAYVYLLVHVREPLRLNLGDPEADARVLSWARGHLGIGGIAPLRLVMLACSGLAMWLLFAYVRRLYSARIASIAAALWSTSFLWMTYADSLDLTPVMTAAMFLALWGVVRALETKHPLHYGAALVGSAGAFATSTHCYVFLPAAVLVTVYMKGGNPFARGRRHFVAICMVGCVLGLIVAAPHFEGAARTSLIPVLTRRLTLVLTPFAWIAAVVHALKAIRAPNVSAAIKDSAAWMLVAALVFVAMFPRLAASHMVTAQVFLPLYAVGSALVLDWLLQRSKAMQQLAFAWLVAASLWSFGVLALHPRAALDRDDVARANAYLAKNDQNDFVVSSLNAPGPVAAVLHRHEWPPLDAKWPTYAAVQMLGILEVTGTDVVHALIAKDPDSRFIDSSLWPLAHPRRQWWAIGWPHLTRTKTRALIHKYDTRVKENLDAVPATKVLDLETFALYRVDRANLLAHLGNDVPVTTRIDFGQREAARHLLLGWNVPRLLPSVQVAVATVAGFARCEAVRSSPRGNSCKTFVTPSGLRTHAAEAVTGQLMIRVERACDLGLTFSFATPSYMQFTINGFSSTPAAGSTMSFSVPAANLTPGINVIEVTSRLPWWIPVHLARVDLAPACPTP